jgi:hypothetical protein
MLSRTTLPSVRRLNRAVASADANQLFNAKRTEILTHMFGDNAV